MKKSTVMRCAVLLALTAGAVLAADVTGKWTGQMGGPDGDGPSITFNFKQDGTKLTGTVDGPGGDPLQISDGKVEGDKISFTLKMDRGDGSMKIIHDGTIKGDEITLNTKMEGGGPGGPGGRGPGGPGGEGGPGGPGGGPRPMTIKRAK